MSWYFAMLTHSSYTNPKNNAFYDEWWIVWFLPIASTFPTQFGKTFPDTNATIVHTPLSDPSSSFFQLSLVCQYIWEVFFINILCSLTSDFYSSFLELLQQNIFKICQCPSHHLSIHKPIIRQIKDDYLFHKQESSLWIRCHQRTKYLWFLLPIFPISI